MCVLVLFSLLSAPCHSPNSMASFIEPEPSKPPNTADTHPSISPAHLMIAHSLTSRIASSSPTSFRLRVAFPFVAPCNLNSIDVTCALPNVTHRKTSKQNNTQLRPTSQSRYRTPTPTHPHTLTLTLLRRRSNLFPSAARDSAVPCRHNLHTSTFA